MATPPASPQDGPESPALTVAAVARRLGVAPATLRTWDRRYGLGPTSHTAGSHRRYTPVDLARLGVMRRLTLEGVAPGEAARVARAADAGGLAEAEPPAGAVPAGDAPAGRGSAGRVVALPDTTPEARGLTRAAMALDSSACSSILRASLNRRGVVPTWDFLLVPVLIGVGERWRATGQGVDVEHLLSECVMGALRAVTVRLQEPANVRPVLLACAEEEQHSLPLHVLAAALAERRVESRILGSRVPRDALAAAMRRSGPAAVFLWAQRPATGNPDQLSHLPTLRPAPLLVTGGPGWQRDTLPAEVAVSSSLGEAVELVVSATGV